LANSEKQGFFREMPDVKRPAFWPGFARAVGMSVVVGVLLGTFGPFGTFESMKPVARYAFWLTCMLAGTCIHLPAYTAAQRIGEARGGSPWLWVTLAALAAAAPMTFMVNGIAASMFPGATFDSVFGLYPFVVSVSLPVLVIVHLLETRKAQALVRSEAAPEVATDADQEAPRAQPRSASTPLTDSIPVRLGREILCLQMEDHYVRVHTALGDAMLHGRMADFEAELVGRIDGLRVHRSWWVARAAVTGWTREDKALTLTLRNGLGVPVARDRQADIKSAGWLS
jgi:LytTr DNA-binding domain